MRRMLFVAILLYAVVMTALAGQSAAQCVTATGGGGWVNSSFSAQTGTFTATFDATPSLSNMNSVVGFSHGAGIAYSAFANLVAFNGTTGTILARNGGVYAGPTPALPYSGGNTYHFRLVVNIPTHTYSVFVTPPGGSELTVGSNFAFRTEQNMVTSLNNLGVFVGATTGSLAVCHFSIAGDAPDFTLTASPSSQTIAAGASTTYSVSVGSVNGFSGNVALSVSGLPSGASGSFNPASMSGSGGSVLTVTTPSSTPTNSYALTITGSSGSLFHSFPVTLNVNSGVSDFMLSAMPTSQTVTAGNSASYTVSVTPQNSFDGNVALSVSGLPAGASGSFNPASVTGSGNSTLNITTLSSTTTGTSTLTVTGDSGSLSHTANASLTVKPVSTGTDWSVAVVNSTMKRFSPSTIGGWSYPVGLYLHGQYLVYKRTKNPSYLQFIQSWADRFVDSAGNINNGFGSLDSMQPVVVLLDLFQETGLAKYRIAAGHMRARLNTYPRTSDGGFWHADTSSRAHQLWGDGTFMVLPGLIRYGQLANDSVYANNEVGNQLEIYASHLQDRTGDAASGLFFHAFDESRTQSWANKTTGDSPEKWCRAMGWYAMATIEALEILPANDPHRAPLIAILKNLISGLAKFQDPATGRWFQVVDKPTVAGNFTETSSSSMYTFVISRAVERGYVDSSFLSVAQKGYQGVLQRISLDSSGMTNLTQICIGTNVGDLAFYLARPRATNDFHGLGSFLIMNEQLTK
ncbi:MAG TPA: glycoside hydrolase family 88 protein [Terriglobales bacterium]|nr:glycoside hydrolase family 88 protein [Terriglobales bacterium]